MNDKSQLMTRESVLVSRSTRGSVGGAVPFFQLVKVKFIFWGLGFEN